MHHPKSQRRNKYAIALTASLLTALGPNVATAQHWAGILDPSRALDWSTAGVLGGIPHRTIVCATLSPGATSSQINAAIANCPGGQVVYLSAGTYNLSRGIDFGGKSNVTLRGAGADKTQLNLTGTASCYGQEAGICVKGTGYAGPWGPPNVANWTAGYSKGTATINLSNTANLTVGSLLILNQLNDSGDNGTIFTCSSSPACSYGDYGGGGVPGKREQLEHVIVTAINGKQVTISDPLAMPNWRAERSPEAWWASNKPATGNGIENLSLKHNTGTSGIMFLYVANSWVKGVKSVNAPRNHVWIWEGAHITIRDSYFYESQSHASQSYGIETLMGSHNLIENNIIHKVTAPLMASGSATGTVFGYNFSLDDTYVTAGWMQPSSYFHAAGTGYVLHEGNQGVGLISDQVHGASFFVTAFRNQWDGWEPGKSAQTVPVHIYTKSRYFNIVGNVLGRSGYHTKYASSPGSTSNCYKSIYALGFGGNCSDGGGSNPPNDNLVPATLMRWGNYDVVNSAPRFDTSEVPSGINPYKNLVPSTQALPGSFYLTSKPTWWGPMPWPAIGPDVTGGEVSGAGGRAWRIPARVCHDSASKDANGAITSFNAGACYGEIRVPALDAPLNLRIQ